MVIHDGAHDVEAEAGPAQVPRLLFGAAPEHLEHVLEILPRDPVPAVGDVDAVDHGFDRRAAG